MGLQEAARCAKVRWHSMQNPDFSEIVTLICKEDPRFDRKAYDFVRLGLDHTVKELRKKDAARAEKSS